MAEGHSGDHMHQRSEGFKALIHGASFAHLATASGTRWPHRTGPGIEHPEQRGGAPYVLQL